jgi:hypothetical protein
MAVPRAWRRIVSGLLLVLAAGVLPLRATAASGPLFTARWDASLAGWQPLGDGGWKVTNGMAAYRNHTGVADLVAPYRLGSLHDFAVEAAIARVGGPGGSAVYAERGYGVFVRGTGKQGADVGGGFFYGEPLGGGSYPQSALDWGGTVLRGASVALHAGFNTFRLEVHGDHYAVFENSVLTTQAAVKGFRGDRVGVFSRQYRILVRSFRVFALPPKAASGGPPASLLARLAALNLHPQDAPAGFHRDYGEYYTNHEVALQRGIPVESLRQAGRLLSYGVEYGQFPDPGHPEKGENVLVVTIAACRTASAARADYAYVLSTYGSDWSRLPAPGRYGVEDSLTTLDWESSGVRYRTDDLNFVRRMYRVSVRFVSVRGTVPDTAPMQWIDTAAQAVDTRVSHEP